MLLNSSRNMQEEKMAENTAWKQSNYGYFACDVLRAFIASSEITLTHFSLNKKLTKNNKKERKR